ncbi:hypothetical protein FB599_2784 [Herbaspirillum sp. SJZ130]|nr:hypothetical protein [Herbaspirillum sp. SJZ102]TQK04233.1 hypothetical protein FB599_2784 [Herbaspirillum sp. SJZ130]TQK09982.1 hypothetical protein FB598_2978 [Herbaspirillum sp. SJZ106]TWC63571.1 hypothetical protein FB597_1104 [Herbaspirillum sp. SJZ099]
MAEQNAYQVADWNGQSGEYWGANQARQATKPNAGLRARDELMRDWPAMAGTLHKSPL